MGFCGKMSFGNLGNRQRELEEKADVLGRFKHQASRRADLINNYLHFGFHRHQGPHHNPSLQVQLDYEDGDFLPRYQRRPVRTLLHESRTHPFTRYFTMSVPVYVHYVFQLLQEQPLQWNLWTSRDVFIGPDYPQPMHLKFPFNDRLVCCTSNIYCQHISALLPKVQEHMLAHALEYYVRYMSPRPWNLTQEAKMSYVAGSVAADLCVAICAVPKCPDPGRWLTRDLLRASGFTARKIELDQDLPTLVQELHFRHVLQPLFNRIVGEENLPVTTVPSETFFLLKDVYLTRFNLRLRREGWGSGLAEDYLNESLRWRNNKTYWQMRSRMY